MSCPLTIKPATSVAGCLPGHLGLAHDYDGIPRDLACAIVESGGSIENKGKAPARRQLCRTFSRNGALCLRRRGHSCTARQYRPMGAHLRQPEGRSAAEVPIAGGRASSANGWKTPSCRVIQLRWSASADLGGVAGVYDAAHPMYPVGSNGASRAILDARCLADLLAACEHPQQAPAAYEAHRLPKT